MEKTLAKMKESWVGIDLYLMEYHYLGTYVLQGLDDTIEHLDDNVVMAQSLAFATTRGRSLTSLSSGRKISLLHRRCWMNG